MTDWPQIHSAVVEHFRAGRDRPHPHAWDGLLDDRVRFVQPMLSDGDGPDFWWEEAARLLIVVPDLRADVLSWSGRDEHLFIHIRFTGTLGGRPLTWTAVDLLRLSPEGKLLHRESFFDSVPVAATLLRRPGSWWRWWRSGVGPLAVRRRLLSPLPDPATTHPEGS
jgi:hypothetical protein